MSQLAEATIEDLYREPGKAEWIDGRIVRFPLMGAKPNLCAARIARALAEHEERSGSGHAAGPSLGFTVPSLRSGRRSFCPDASWFTVSLPKNPFDFIDGPPTLAVEVRRRGDYGDIADATIGAKRLDYFEAGTLVVWDVDPIAETVSVFRRSDPEHAVVYRRSQEAEAEPAVPGWKVKVDWILL